MNIKILDSWLRDYLTTKAPAHKIGEALSLTSVGVERIEPHGKHDFVYDIEVTTNRPDLMSVIGLAREAAVVLPDFGYEATFRPLKVALPKSRTSESTITIKNDPKLVNRITAAVMEVTVKPSDTQLSERLETSDIRSLNNVIDITNYVMRETGHPAHVFDYDRLTTRQLIIREADSGEQIITLDGKKYTLSGGEIVADNGEGEIVDLLGIMGLENSVVTESTKRILLFLDNNDPHRIRKASMSLGIRTEAAQLNEKGVDRETMYEAFIRAIDLYRTHANGRIVSEIIDIYPNKLTPKEVTVSIPKISRVIGVEIPEQKSISILKKLGFLVSHTTDTLTVGIPSWRYHDVSIQEDIIEEIARIYGYHNLDSILPSQSQAESYHMGNDRFYWEQIIKHTLANWGFTETYTYSMISKDVLEVPSQQAVTIQNPLSEDHVYMRTSLVPSLLEVMKNNPSYESCSLFEMASVYLKRTDDLPEEITHLGLAIQRPRVDFYSLKGIVEQLFDNLGIKGYEFKKSEQGGLTARIFIQNQMVGVIEQLDAHRADVEIDMDRLLEFVSLKKTYTPVAKYPPIIEDIRLLIPEHVTYQQVVNTIQSQSSLIRNVLLHDVYQDKKTVRIIYQSENRNLSDDDITVIREKIKQILKKKLQTHIV